MGTSKAVVEFGKPIFVDEKRCKWVFERVDVLLSTANNVYAELCELMHEISRDKLYKQVKNKDGKNYTRFEDYSADKFGKSDRTGDYHLAIQKKLVIEGKITRDDLSQIEWAKAKELARLPASERTTEKLKEKWIPEAKKTKVEGLKASVNKTINSFKDKEERQLKEETTIHRTFCFSEDQVEVVDRAIDLAKKIGNSTVISHALECVCLDFIGSRCEEADVKMDRILGAVERHFGVEIVAFKYKGQEVEIVHGQKLAKKYGIE